MNRSSLKQYACICAIAIAGAGSIAAQSNERIDELLNQDPATLGHTSYLVLSAAGDVPEDASPASALETAKEQGWVPADAVADDPVRFGRFSYLLTGAFDVPGGVMYRVFPGPRYAAREVAFQGWSLQRRPARELIGGEIVVRTLSTYLNEEGADQ
jgi:hypothetical protein